MIECGRLLRAVADEHPRPLVFATVSGAHLYGFASPDSDFDIRGVHLASPDELLGLADCPETIEQSGVREGREIDLVTHDARKFIRLMLKRNGYVLEQLLSPLVVVSTPDHEELVELGRGCITRHHVHHYLGFARNQWDLFRKEQPPRVKPLLYTYRVLLTGIHLMRTGEIQADLVALSREFGRSWIDDLIATKTEGHEAATLDAVDLAFHAGEFERLRDELEEAGRRSSLPDEPTVRDDLNALLLRLRRRACREWAG
jgi:predicted nucleotidyltransferase